MTLNYCRCEEGDIYPTKQSPTNKKSLIQFLKVFNTFCSLEIDYMKVLHLPLYLAVKEAK